MFLCELKVGCRLGLDACAHPSASIYCDPVSLVPLYFFSLSHKCLFLTSLPLSLFHFQLVNGGDSLGAVSMYVFCNNKQRDASNLRPLRHDIPAFSEDAGRSNGWRNNAAKFCRSGKVICGLKTKDDHCSALGACDDSGLNDLSIKCCSLP